MSDVSLGKEAINGRKSSMSWPAAVCQEMRSEISQD